MCVCVSKIIGRGTLVVDLTSKRYRREEEEGQRRYSGYEKEEEIQHIRALFWRLYLRFDDDVMRI